MFATLTADAWGQVPDNQPLPSTEPPSEAPETERFDTIDISQIVWIDGVSDGSLSTFDED